MGVTYNYLDIYLPWNEEQPSPVKKAARNAGIGLAASFVSDVMSNGIASAASFAFVIVENEAGAHGSTWCLAAWWRLVAALRRAILGLPRCTPPLPASPARCPAALRPGAAGCRLARLAAIALHMHCRTALSTVLVQYLYSKPYRYTWLYTVRS